MRLTDWLSGIQRQIHLGNSGRLRQRRNSPPSQIAAQVSWLEERQLLSSTVNANVDFSVTNDWGSGFGAAMSIKNNSTTAVNGWTLEFDFSKSIDQIWNAQIVSHVGNHYVLKDMGYNATIAAGAAVSFGFNGSSGNVTTKPTNYVLNGSPLATSTAVPTLSIANVSITEGKSGTTTANFAVTLSQVSTKTVGVAFATGNGTATARTDFIATQGTLTFSPGQTSKTIAVMVNGDATVEPDEDFFVTLSSPSNATLARTQARGLIVNDDQPPVTTGAASVDFSVTNDWGTGFGASMSIMNNSTAAVNGWTLEFDFPNSIDQIWNVQIASHVGNHYVLKDMGYNASIAAGATVSFGFNGSPGNVTVKPANYILNGAPLGTSGSTPTLSIADVSVTEGQSVTTTATFTVTLSQASTKTVSVAYATSNGTATAGADFVAAQGTLTFSPGQTSKTIAVTVIGDATVEPDENFFVTLSSPSNATVARAQARGTITNDDGVAAVTWPAHVFAPYVDMAGWPTPDLVSIAQTSGTKFFTLAFIVADTTGTSNQPAWGGYDSYAVNGSDFDLAMRAQINAVRTLGGDVSVSFGGAANSELAQVITNVPALQAAYQKVIDAYGLTRIDFDIEGAAVADKASIDRRSQAMAGLQQAAAAAGKPLQIWLTLPVLPSGLTADGLYVVQSAKQFGVKLAGVNVMAMDYGDSAAPNPTGQMGKYAIAAATSTFNQLKGLYGTSLTDSQLWSMIGVTPMIGVNDVSTEVFNQAAASQLETWAKTQGIGMLSMWSIGRDQPNQSGVTQAAYAFSSIFDDFVS